MGKKRGFTLIELMVTITVAAILATVAVPSYQSFILSNRMASHVNELIMSLTLARSEAIKNRAVTYVCSSSDAKSCGSDWSAGWIVWMDRDRDNKIDVDDPVIHSYASKWDSTILSVKKNQNSSSISFRSDGSSPVGTSFLFCDPRGADHARTIVASSTGRMRVERVEDGYSLPASLSCS